MDKKKTKQGVTLLEVVFASIVLVLVFSSFLTTVTMFKRSAVMAEARMRAMNYARGTMDYLTFVGYTNPLLNISTTKPLNKTESPVYHLPYYQACDPLSLDVHPLVPPIVYPGAPGVSDESSFNSFQTFYAVKSNAVYANTKDITMTVIYAEPASARTSVYTVVSSVTDYLH